MPGVKRDSCLSRKVRKRLLREVNSEQRHETRGKGAVGNLGKGGQAKE